MSDWTEFGLRHLPTMSAVEPFSSPPEMAPVIEGLMAVVQQSLAVPVRGITSDGAVIPGLFTSTAGRTSTGAIGEAAAAFLGSLNAIDAQSAQLARTLLDATVAHPRPASGPSHRDVTIVIPVRNNAFGVTRAGLDVVPVGWLVWVPVGIGVYEAVKLDAGWCSGRTRSRFLRDGVSGEAERENSRCGEGLDHGRGFLWLENPDGSG